MIAMIMNCLTYNYSPMEGTASTIDLSTMDEGNYKIAVRSRR